MKTNGTKESKPLNLKRSGFTNPFSSVVKNFGRKNSATESEKTLPQDGSHVDDVIERKISFDFDHDYDDIQENTNHRTNSAGSQSQSSRRDNVNRRELLMGLSDLSANYLDLVLRSKGIDWIKSLCLRDPRYNIKLFFDDVAKDGANKIEDGVFQPEMLSPIIAMFQRSSVFSVWRPTSIESISKMMKGHGVGKGLDIKGKSAKKGKLSAFVPFLQIHQDEHKTKIRSLPSGGRIRVFYRKEVPREKAYNFLMEVMNDMIEKVAKARAFLVEQPIGQRGEDDSEI